MRNHRLPLLLALAAGLGASEVTLSLAATGKHHSGSPTGWAWKRFAGDVCELPFATPSGTLRLKLGTDTVIVDADDDGAFTDADPTVKMGEQVNVPVRLGGELQDYSISIRGTLRPMSGHVAIASHTTATATWDGIGLRLLDGNCDGRFDTTASIEGRFDRVLAAAGEPPNAHTITPDVTSAPMGSVVFVVDRLVTASWDDDLRLSFDAYTGPVATLETSAEDDVARTLTLIAADGSGGAVLTPPQPTVKLVPGTYRIAEITGYYTDDRDIPFTLLSGRAPQPTVDIAAGANSLQLGAPYSLAFTASYTDSTLHIDTASLVGAAGEKYRALPRAQSARRLGSLSVHLVRGEAHKRVSTLEYG